MAELENHQRSEEPADTDAPRPDPDLHSSSALPIQAELIEHVEPAAVTPVVSPNIADVTTQNEPDSIRSDAFSEFQPAAPAELQLELIGAWIFGAVVAVAGCITAGILAMTLSVTIAAWTLLGTTLSAIALLIAQRAYCRRSHHMFRWRLGPHGLEIHRGIWWRQEIAVPRDRIQHVDIHQGPLMRRFGLAMLIVHTAGTVDSSIGLEGLHDSVARQLRGLLTQGNEQDRAQRSLK
ncbi:MAG: PH domain-containing protein [Pirellulales bacterium]